MQGRLTRRGDIMSVRSLASAEFDELGVLKTGGRLGETKALDRRQLGVVRLRSRLVQQMYQSRLNSGHVG